MYIIETDNLCKAYEKKMVVNNVNMHIEEASIYGFVGENGSGKTTIMRLLTGLAEPTFGSYRVCGVDHKDINVYKVRQNISAIVETVSMVPSMSARDNMIYHELNLGCKLTEEQRQNLLDMVNLGNTGDKKAKNFSLGMRQRLGIAMALINNPKVLILDEPMNGLDPEGIAELRDLLVKLNKNEGITVLISSHILSELEKIATCYGFISHGKIIEEISAEELQARCRKSLNVKVDNPDEAQKIIADLGVKDFKVSSTGDIKIFENVQINNVVTALSSKNIAILGINSADESVEEYYLNLIKDKEEK